MSDYIHEDNLFQILKWLPAESLLRFRSVCKGWKERIDSQFFTLDYLSVQKPRLIVEYDQAKEFLAFDISNLPVLDTMIRPIVHIPERRFHLANTLHGIVCFYNEFRAQFILWNPCIRKFSDLPPPKFKSFNWDEYDNDTYGTHGGFWIDPSTKNFKVVMFKLPLFEEYDVADVSYGGFYSSIQRDWKEISLEEIQGYHNAEVTPPVVIEEVAYWRAFHEYTDNEQVSMIGVVVLFFDFAQEKFGTIQALSVKEGWDLPVLCNWEGGGPSLVYMDPGKGCDIYLRDEDSWVETFRIPLRSDISRVLWGTVQIEEMSLVVRILATNKSSELVLFDTKNMSFRILEAGLKDWAEFAVTYGFVESLLFPSV